MQSDKENASEIGTRAPMSAVTEPKPHIVIAPLRGWRSLKLKEVWEFRDLLVSLGMRDVKVIYKQTILGVLWVVLQPLIGAGIFTFVFGMLAEMESGAIPYFLFAFAGMLAWTLFSTTLSAASTVLVMNAHLVSKIYFPRLILPLSSAFQPVLNFGVGLILMLILLPAYGVFPSWRFLFLPVASLLLLALALGVGFFCSAIIVRYRDLRYVIPVAIQFLLYASPIGYSLSAINDKVPAKYQSLYMLNPLASLFEFFRWSVFSDGNVGLAWLAYGAFVSISIFFLGAFAFRRAERNFADVI